jgi:polyisoprenoid-binding protein YceI
MLKKLTLLLLLISSMSFSQEWIQDKEETSISFKIKNFGLFKVI